MFAELSILNIERNVANNIKTESVLYKLIPTAQRYGK